MMRRLLRRILESRFRIATQLYAGLGGGVLFTISASLVAWLSFNQVGEVQRQVNEKSIPEIVAAFEVARQARALVDAAPQLTTSTAANFEEISANISLERRAFETLLASLAQHGNDDADGEENQQVAGVRVKGVALIMNLQAIEDSVARRLTRAEQAESRRVDLEELDNKLSGILIPAIDDQLFYTMTGYYELGRPPAPKARHLSPKEIDRYRNLAKLEADTTLAMQLIASAYTLSDIALVEPLMERFEATAGSIQRSLSALGAEPAGQATAPLFARFFELSLGEQGSFNLRASELTLIENQHSLLNQNRALANELVNEVNGLVSTAQAHVDAATLASSQSINNGRRLLLALNILSIIGAVLIAWLFVGRVLLHRLELLSSRMRQMADGDLEGKVKIEGHDEVAEMAAALEGFRRNALEVQRLNLVEKLAKELEGKNEELEHALENLRHAQDQVVAQGKLAALGELTAGVAHEIKNPLNFVNNFSAASEELLEELKECLPGEGDALTREQLDEITDTTNFLSENLKRIRNHGERADRIVTDMLRLGRDSDEAQETDINNLVDEHARLAFHAARANDPNFRLDLRVELDPAAGSLMLVPQDLGRVFLSLVTNACYATDERRKSIEGENPHSHTTEALEERFHPTLWITSRNLGEEVEVRVKDNGTGIPQEVIEKIFNPFFTTKPTDQGTGLGLALSSDIVRKHGGTIEVNSEIGKFTEMIVTLPRESNLLEHQNE